MTRKRNRSRAQRKAAKQDTVAALLEKQEEEESRREALRRKMDEKRRLKKLGKEFTDKLAGGLSRSGFKAQSEGAEALRVAYDEIVEESTGETFYNWVLAVQVHSRV